jgi:prepilin peptidase CpaA
MTPDLLKLAASGLALAFPALAIVAALRDATTMTIPNWISAALGLLFVPAALFAGLPMAALGWALAAGVAALLAGMAMFALGWIGGGDAKLFAACALWLGLAATPVFLLITALAGGALAVLLLGARKFSHALTGPAWVERLLKPGGDVPYGLAICVGALFAFPESPLVKALTGG